MDLLTASFSEISSAVKAKKISALETTQFFQKRIQNIDKKLNSFVALDKTAEDQAKKIDESIDAWKNALRLNPADSDARENLVKALLEKKKQEQQNKKDKPDKKKSDDKQKKEQNKPDNTPKPQQSKLSKQQVEQYLRSLEQREKDVQDKMNQNKTHTLSQPDKDW